MWLQRLKGVTLAKAIWNKNRRRTIQMKCLFKPNSLRLLKPLLKAKVTTTAILLQGLTWLSSPTTRMGNKRKTINHPKGKYCVRLKTNKKNQELNPNWNSTKTMYLCMKSNQILAIPKLPLLIWKIHPQLIVTRVSLGTCSSLSNHWTLKRDSGSPLANLALPLSKETELKVKKAVILTLLLLRFKSNSRRTNRSWLETC